jgi:hypothetical protein
VGLDGFPSGPTPLLLKVLSDLQR